MKIGVIGGGNIGGVICQELVRRRLARTVALMDVAEPALAEGKCLDISEGTPMAGDAVTLVGGKSYDVLAGCDLVINTAGVPRKPKPDGSLPSREELLATNLRITDLVAGGIAEHCPEAIVISIANPLDAIVYRLHQKLALPPARLMGMAGALDSARYRFFVAREIGVSVENVQAMVLGGHGDTMVPIRSACRVAGLPVESFIGAERLAAIEARTRGAGGEVVKLLGTGSAFVSPAWGAIEMTEAIVRDEKKIVPSCVYLQGEYGLEGLFVGVPVVLGAGGVERIIEIDLTDEEQAALQASADAVRKTCAEVDELAGSRS